MNPSTKVAGLSFQLSSPPKRDDPSFEQRSDLRLHDGRALLLASLVRISVLGLPMFYPPANYLPEPPEHSVISRYLAVCSGEAESALTYTLILPDHEGFLMDYLSCGSDSSSPRLRLREASSEQLR